MYDDFMREIYELLDKFNNLGPGDILGEKILHVTDPKEIIDMQKEINDFLDSDVPEKEK